MIPFALERKGGGKEAGYRAIRIEDDVAIQPKEKGEKKGKERKERMKRKNPINSIRLLEEKGGEKKTGGVEYSRGDLRIRLRSQEKGKIKKKKKKIEKKEGRGRVEPYAARFWWSACSLRGGREKKRN